MEVALHFQQARCREASRNLFAILLDWASLEVQVACHPVPASTLDYQAVPDSALRLLSLGLHPRNVRNPLHCAFGLLLHQI